MAGNILTTLSPMDGVAASGLATRELNVVGIIHGVQLDFRKADDTRLTLTELEASVDTIQIKVGGDILIDITPNQWRDFFRYVSPHGLEPGGGNPSLTGTGATTPGAITGIGALLHISLQPWWWANTAVANQLGWGMSGIASNQVLVQVKFKAAISVARVDVNVDSTAEPQPLGAHFRIERFPFHQESPGTLDVTSLPLEDDIAVLGFQLHAQTAGLKAKIDTVRLQFNDVQQRQEVPPEALDEWQRVRGYTPGPNSLFLDMNVDRNANDFVALSRVQRASIRLKTSGANNELDQFSVYRIGVGGVTAEQRTALAQLPAVAA